MNDSFVLIQISVSLPPLSVAQTHISHRTWISSIFDIQTSTIFDINTSKSRSLTLWGFSKFFSLETHCWRWKLVCSNVKWLNRWRRWEENFLNLFEHIIRISIQAFMPCPEHDNFMRLYCESFLAFRIFCGTKERFTKVEVSVSAFNVVLEYYNKDPSNETWKKKFEKFNFFLYFSSYLSSLKWMWTSRT